MSYNHAKLRSLQISQEVQPLSNRNPNSSRVQPISLLSSHILSQGSISTRISNIDDDVLSANTTERLRASINSKKGKVIQSSNVADKENLNSDADDLFDNFDRCYRARFITNEKSSAKENKSLPVCRDLSSEFAAGSSSGLSGVKTPLAVGNSGYFQRPKEFQVSKAGRYFDMKTPNSSNNGLVTKLQVGAKNEEDVENEDEEHRQISVKNILTRRSTNYELEQKTLNKIKKGDYRIEMPNQRRVLDDVTNNTERHTHKPTSAHEGPAESNRMSFVEMFTRRGTVGKQALDKKKNSLSQNGHDETKKLSIPNMLAFLQKRENLQPPTRNSYNGRGCESHRIINHTAKEVEKPATSVSRKDQNKQQSKPKAAAVSGRHSARLEHENNGSRGSVKVYESLLRYFEVAKKELSRSNSNVKRSSSGHRRE